MATSVKTLKLPFLGLNQAKAVEFLRLQTLNTEVANSILKMPKQVRQKLTSKSFNEIEIGSAWINQTIRNANAKTKVKSFLTLPLETNNQNWTLHKTGDTFSIGFGLLRGIKKRVPVEVHCASHLKLLTAMIEGEAQAGSIKLWRSKKGIWYALLSVSMEVPDAVGNDRWIGIDRGQNVPSVAALPNDTGAGVVFWRAPRIKHIRRTFAARRKKLQKQGKHRAVLKLEQRERRIITHVNHVISKEIVGLAVRHSCGIRLEDLFGIRKSAQSNKAKTDAGQNRDYWPFYQLEQFLAYKAQDVSVQVDKIPPAYTSKSCHRCGRINSRKKHAYACTCGHQAHADANAAMNIRDWYGLCCPLELDAPTGGVNESPLNTVSESVAKATA